MNNRHYIIFHNSFDKIAGTERVISSLLELLSSQEGSKITLLLASEPAPLALDIHHHVNDIVYLHNRVILGGKLALLKTHVRLYKAAVKFLQNSDPRQQTVCIVTNPFLGVVMDIARKKLKMDMKIIACEHFAHAVSGGLSKLARSIFYKRMYVVTLTENDRKEIEQRYHPLACICIPNASPFPVTPYLTEGKEKLILSIGRLTPQKGFDLLLQAFAPFTKEYPEWKLLIIGDDYGDKPLLNQLINQYELMNNVSIIPSVNNVDDYYRKAAFYVLSSRFEGLPMVMIEAMSFSLPIVAFNCPTGPAELLNGDNGILVKNGDTGELAKAMALLAGNPELILKQSVAAQHMAANYSKERINRMWLDFFEKIGV